MSGYDQLGVGLARLQEFGFDDPAAHDALLDAILSEDLSQEDMALAYSALGSAYHAIGRQEDALGCLTTVVGISRDPARLALAHHELGETLFALDREPEAEAHYRESLRLDRQHPCAPDTMLLLGRALYMRWNRDGGEDADLLDEAYRHFAEAFALLDAAEPGTYALTLPHEKVQFDAAFGMAVCKSDMSLDTHRFEALRLFEQAEQLGLARRDLIPNAEIENVYKSWIALHQRMGRDRDATLVMERAERALR